MSTATLHIINGDGAAGCLAKAGIAGEILVCRDLLYDGVRKPGWPDDATLLARSQFLSRLTAGGLESDTILQTLQSHYQKLATAPEFARVVLWFDACLCDQAMLAHTLVCLQHLGCCNVALLCVESFPGISPFNGLGQLQPSQMASLYDGRRTVDDEQFTCSEIAERAFATQDLSLLEQLSRQVDAPLVHIPAAAARWLDEQPDPKTGLGRLEHLALNAIRSGCTTPGGIFVSVARDDTSPQFWGDTILWQKINSLAGRNPPLVHIDGPAEKLPQWESSIELKLFEITPAVWKE